MLDLLSADHLRRGIFFSRCKTQLHASRPMWLKPRPPSLLLQARDGITVRARDLTLHAGIPKHPSRRSRDTYADDESATKPRPAAEIARPEVAIRQEPSLVRTPQAGVSREPAAGLCWQECLNSAVKDIRHLHACQMFGTAETEEPRLGDGLLVEEKRHWPLRIAF